MAMVTTCHVLVSKEMHERKMESVVEGSRDIVDELKIELEMERIWDGVYHPCPHPRVFRIVLIPIPISISDECGESNFILFVFWAFP